MNSVGLQLSVVLFCVASVLWTPCDAANAKEGTTSSATQTDPPTTIMSILEFIAAMPVTAQLRSGALVVAFLAILFWDRRADTWIRSMVCLGALGGLSYYFNPAGAGHLEGSPDFMHEYLTQFLGAMMLAQVYTVYSLSSENQTRTIIFLIQALASVMVLVVRSYGHFKYAKDAVHFDNEHLSFGIPCAALIGLGSIIFLYRQSQGAGGRAETFGRGALNTHLLIDGFLMCFMAVFDLAFPDVSLAMVEGVKPDGILATFLRHSGVALLCDGIASFLFISVSNEEDKKTKLRFNIILPALYLPLVVLYQIKYSMVALPTLLATLAFSLLPTGNAICALYIRGQGKKYV